MRTFICSFSMSTSCCSLSISITSGSSSTSTVVDASQAALPTDRAKRLAAYLPLATKLCTSIAHTEVLDLPIWLLRLKPGLLNAGLGQAQLRDPFTLCVLAVEGWGRGGDTRRHQGMHCVECVQRT